MPHPGPFFIYHMFPTGPVLVQTESLPTRDVADTRLAEIRRSNPGERFAVGDAAGVLGEET